RPVGAQEVLSIELANRVVPKGKGVEEAVKVARLVVGMCLNLDRRLCWYAAYEATSLEDVLGLSMRMGFRRWQLR
ncbi:hypothetical protein V5O48_003802, partial [Marasmius crinis-equi]